jgi:hypothetical protein
LLQSQTHHSRCSVSLPPTAHPSASPHSLFKTEGVKTLDQIT